MDLWRCGRIRCLHLIRIASCKTYSLQRFRVLGASFSSFGCFVFEFWGFVFELGCFVFEFWVLRFRTLGASFSNLGASFSNFGCFVFEFWVLRFRTLGASFSSFGCFVLRSSFSSASFSKLPLKTHTDTVHLFSKVASTTYKRQFKSSAFRYEYYYQDT